jgi:glycosyltransferase involved in cell wall biosynthesis
MTLTAPIKLSVLICSLHDRWPSLGWLVENLYLQEGNEKIEILIAVDSGQELIGAKRNRLVQAARGDYVVHIDDDDRVSRNYIPNVLAAMASKPDVIAIRGQRIDIRGRSAPITFDFCLQNVDGTPMSPTVADTDRDGVLWRSPGHLCPMRAAIAKASPFPETEPEDIVWLPTVRPLLRTIVRAGEPNEILYHYQWDSMKSYRWNRYRAATKQQEDEDE